MLSLCLRFEVNTYGKKKFFDYKYVDEYLANPNLLSAILNLDKVYKAIVTTFIWILLKILVP